MKGFTLVEIIIVVSIMAFLSGLVIPRLGAFSRAHILDQAALDFKSNLEEARSRSMSSLNHSGKQVHWGVAATGSASYMIGEMLDDGSSPGVGTNDLQTVESFALPSGVTLSPTNVETIFERITGNVLEGAGTYTLSRAGSTASITVSDNGNIE